MKVTRDVFKIMFLTFMIATKRNSNNTMLMVLATTISDIHSQGVQCPF